MDNAYIPVVFTCSEQYLPYARVTIRSILAHTKAKLDVIIGHYDVPEPAQKRYLASFTEEELHGCTVRFVSVKEYLDNSGFLKAKVSERFPKVVFYRLVLPEILMGCDKIVYLDSDLVLTRDIKELYDVDLGENLVAATRGMGFPFWVKSDPKRLAWYRQQGIAEVSEYFNSGVVVINARAFRRNGLLPQMVQKAVSSPYFPEQDALNIVCRGRVTYLDPKWNVCVAYCRWRMYDADGAAFRDILDDAYVLHYNSTHKPWAHPALANAEVWWRYAKADECGPTSIGLYYYNDWPNFGDSLSQKLVAALSGATVEYAAMADAEMMGAGSLFSSGDRLFGTEDRPLEPGKPTLHVWGAGFLEPQIPEGPIHHYRDMVVHAVRGRKTLDALRQVGYVGPNESPALGDPGLFYADLFPETGSAEKKYDLALIPHRHDQVAALKMAETLRDAGYSVVYVDVMLSEPSDIILQIAQSRKVLSSSLHGIIVADSLGVPNRRLVFDDFTTCPQCQRSISHFKFEDYYSAFGLEAPAYETEAHVLADPRAIVEAIGPGDCVPAAKVEECKAALRASFPIPENARRAPSVRPAEVTAPKDRRMKVLMVCEPDFLNPFPQHIYNELLEYDLDADCSADAFWTCDPGEYDIVHVQFPEALFNWHPDDLSPVQVKRLAERFAAFRAAGCKIVYTRHNQTVHIPRKGCIDKVYRMLDAKADGILHMGRYSLMECRGKNPNSLSRHYVVPHHTYPHLLRKVDRETCCEQLGLDPDRPVVLSFGSFRNQQERELVRNAVAGCGVSGVQLLAPALNKGGFVSDHELPIYFGAADVVFLQRVRILNSGNLPLGFYYGKVVVGPNLCDVGEWLRATGNPVFEVFRPGSEAVALAHGLELAKQGLGDRNRRFADREWSVEAVTAKIVAAYADLTGRPTIARAGKMQFKRIDIGLATEYLRDRNRLMAANVNKANEIAKLKAEITKLNGEVSNHISTIETIKKNQAQNAEVVALKAKLAKTVSENGRLSATLKELRKASARLECLSREVVSLKNSEAYRVGMLMTWPFRKCYRAFCRK